MKKILFPVLLGSLLLLTWCSTTNKVELGDIVTILYTGTLTNGEIFETKETTITAWSQQIIDGIDEAILGMKKGKTKKITITPDKWYAYEYNQNNLQKVSKLIFDKLNIEIKEGELVYLWETKGVIKGIEKDTDGNDVILLDINPAQYRQDTTYQIYIEDIQKAELSSWYTL